MISFEKKKIFFDYLITKTINLNNMIPYILSKFLSIVCPCLYKKRTKRPYTHISNQEKQGLLKQQKTQLSQSQIKKNIQQATSKCSQAINLKNQNNQNKQTNLFEQKVQIQQQVEIQSKKFELISQNHPYYQLLKPKIELISSIFNIPEDTKFSEPDTDYPLKIASFSDGEIATFKYFFTFPCKFATYQQIQLDFELQKQLDSNIDQFKSIEKIQNGYLLYLSYKKFLIMTSRDFEYVRYSFKINGEYWNICVSDMSRAQIKGKVRGEMIMTTTKVIERGQYIDVSISSQVDMKMPLKYQLAKSKGISQIRKYLDKIYNHLKKNG